MNARILGDSVLKVVEDGATPAQAVSALVSFAHRMNLEPLLPHIVIYLDGLAQRRRQEKQLQIESPTDLSQGVIDEIRSYVNAAETTEVATSVNTDVISGFVARYNNVQYDASGRRQLKELRQDLLKVLA